MSSTPPAPRSWLTNQSVKNVRVRMALVAAVALTALGGVATPAVADATPSPGATVSASAPAHAKDAFVMGIKADIDSLNPYVGLLVPAFDAYALMYDYLTDGSPQDMTPVPSLAEKWETSADGLTWTFHLRKGVKWSDGKDLTSADVKFSYERVLVPDSTENGQYGSSFSNVTKVEAPDADTFVIHTSEPNASLLAATMAGGVPVVPKHIWENIKDVGSYANDGSDGKPVVGSGPFQLVEAKKGQYYRFKANPGYWNGAPHISELTMVFFQNEETMVQALEKGEIDFISALTAKAFNALKTKSDPTITLNQGPSQYVYELGLNTGAATVDNTPIGDGHPALKDVKVRQAIEYAIDKQTLVDKTLLGAAKVAYGENSPLNSAWYWDPPAAMKRTFAPDKARQLLDEAGYKAGADGVRVGPDGKALTFRLFARSEATESQDQARYIQEWLKEIGIKADVQVVSNDALTDLIGKGKYDMFLWDWWWGPDPEGLLSVFTCSQRSTKDGDAISGGWSDSFYCNPEFENLYKQHVAEMDPAKRKVIVDKALENLYVNAVYATLYYDQTLQAYRNDRFTGFVPQPASGGSMVAQIGTWSYRAIKPYTAPAAAPEDSGGSRTVLIIAGAVVLLLAVGGAVFAMRRRSTADDRE
ncbi:peptide/nickel transport system substrate-binding protein [Catellatospora citrea]|nr:peptide/nickel transport system substrate-binding protein [Catellatospora citrea]